MPNRKLQIKFSPKKASDSRRSLIKNEFKKDYYELDYIKDLYDLKNSKNVAGFNSTGLSKESIERKFSLKLHIE